MTIGERDISALRKCIGENINLSAEEKSMLVDAITVAIIRYEQKVKKGERTHIE